MRDGIDIGRFIPPLDLKTGESPAAIGGPHHCIIPLLRCEVQAYHSDSVFGTVIGEPPEQCPIPPVLEILKQYHVLARLGELL